MPATGHGLAGSRSPGQEVYAWRPCSILEVDLLFFDTTSTHFQVEEATAPRVTGQPLSGEDTDDAATAATRSVDGGPRTTCRGRLGWRDPASRCGCGPGRDTTAPP